MALRKATAPRQAPPSLVRIRSLDAPEPLDQLLELFVGELRAALAHVDGHDAPAIGAVARVVYLVDVVAADARARRERLRLGVAEERRDLRRDVRFRKRLRRRSEL